MDEAELRRIERLYTAMSSGDPAAVAPLCHPDIELRLGMANADWRPGVYRGHAGIGEFLTELGKVWDEVIVTPREIQEVGGALLVRGRIFARGSALGMRDFPAIWRWESEGGLFVRGRVFHRREDAIERLSTPGDPGRAASA